MKSPIHLSIAGKVFVLGEYAVLLGLPAILATVGPRFEMTITEQKGDPPDKPDNFISPFHPQSPAGRLIEWTAQQGPLPRLKLDFRDPHLGRGGFGASTAEFALTYMAFAKAFNWKKTDDLTIWKLYRQLHTQTPRIPSGADLVCQLAGGVRSFQLDPNLEHCTTNPLGHPHDWSNLMIFSATEQPQRKTPTHAHLGNPSHQHLLSRSSSMITELHAVICSSLSALEKRDLAQLGADMDTYADILYRNGLELEIAHEDRLLLRNLPGVLGAKGGGALLSDVVVVLMAQGALTHDKVVALASQRGLRLVTQSLNPEKGLLF